MKLLKLAISSALCLWALTGCMQREEFTPGIDGGIPIHVDGHISQEATKVSANGFELGDALGLYAVNYTDGNQTPGTLQTEGNQADHVKYILSENGWNPVRPVYYKDVNTNVDLYTFYPYAEPKSVTEYTFEVSKDQSTAKKNGILGGYEASDFLWGKVTNVTPTEGKIKVTLEHKMAGAHVILAEGEGFGEGEFENLEKSVMVSGTTRKATIDLATGVVTPLGGAQATGIVMAPQSDGSFRAIVVPQTLAPNTEMFTITVDGIPYRFGKSETFVYEANKLSTFTITLNKKSHTGEYEFTITDTQIIDWKEDLNTHEGEARQYYCVTVSKPGTLGRLIKADKKNPDKIRNLKVSGTISDADFYFMRDSMEILEAVNLKESRVLYTKIDKTETKTYEDIIPESAFSGKKTLFYFTFPEVVKEIGPSAFNNSSISGALVIPDDVTIINYSAFRGTNITSLTLSPVLEKIDEYAFYQCKSLYGTLTFPVTTTYIGTYAFGGCSFSGQLILPENLEYLGSWAFYGSGNKFTGGLRIPDKISKLYDNTFCYSSFTGTLDLNNVTEIEEYCFFNCGFQGELIIPEGVTDIPNQCFHNNSFTTIIFPSSLKTIGGSAFNNISRLTTPLVFPEGMVSIGERAFSYCRQLQGVDFPSTLQSIQSNAFDDCFSINSIISRSVETPTVASDAFSGVAKDNFTLEVPENAVVRYQTDPVWGEFRRISAHHDFSISRPLARALNGEKSRKYTLRAPTNHTWSIESKPEWVTVTPSSGTGKTEITVTINEMIGENTDSTIEYEYTNQWGGESTGYHTGRAGDIVFLLDDKDYRTKMTVEQWDYDHKDGDVYPLQTATKGAGIDLVFLGDCYDAKDIALGTYLTDLQQAYEYFFAVEPYKTYKDYFNVYAVFGLSDDSGVGTVNTVKDAKFGSQYSLAGVTPDFETSYEYAAKANQDLDPAKTLVVMIENTTDYGGITYMWGDGTAIAVCPKSDDAYPYDFRGLVQHEAGGHGFGKLADEYIYTNGFISACACPNPHVDSFQSGKALGWYRNLELTGDPNSVGWSHLIFHSDYSNVVDIYEGGYFHTRGVFRSEPTSCMNNNIPYFSAISRQAIVERIMEYAGEEFTLDNFYAKDSDEVGTTTITSSAVPSSVPESLRYQGKQYPPVYMGDKPNFRR